MTMDSDLFFEHQYRTGTLRFALRLEKQAARFDERIAMGQGFGVRLNGSGSVVRWWHATMEAAQANADAANYRSLRYNAFVQWEAFDAEHSAKAMREQAARLRASLGTL
jgi:hypothetical protein